MPSYSSIPSYLYPIFALVLLFIIWQRKTIKYYLSPYFRASGKSFSVVKNNVGDYGEYVIFNNLIKMRGKKGVLCNLYIKSKNGNYTEIDVVLINRSGVFVIESKNYKGLIVGHTSSQMWTQHLGRTHQNKFYNPILQNSAHIRAIRSVLDCSPSNIYSVIAFNHSSDLSGVDVDPSRATITTIDDINSTVKDIMSDNRKAISKAQISEYYKCLQKFSHAKNSVKKKHISQVKQKQNQNKK